MSTPAFERRGFMLDVSRDRVPTRETLEWLVGVLAALDYNELQLYVEHTFAYAGHEAVWAEASPLTADDMAWLDRVCASHGIDLVANMNGFGHMGRWFAADPALRARAECPDGFEGILGGGWSEPTCLAPTAENAAFAVDLAREIAATVSHRRVHIGGDEPFELGEGVSAGDVAERGRDRVFLEHLLRIVHPLLGDGREVMFWADLFRRDPGLVAAIPDGAIGVVWNYEQPSELSWAAFLDEATLERLGMPDDAHLGFVAHARRFIEAARPFWVAPGTSSWNTILGRNRNAAANIADAVAVGVAHGSPGLLLTDWGDNGHWQPLAVSLPSIVRAAGAARSGDVPSDDEVARTVDDVAGFVPGTGDLLDRLGGIAESIGATSPNGSAVCAVLQRRGLPVLGEVDPAGMATAHELLDEAEATFAAGDVGGPRGAVVAAEMAAACGLARVGLRALEGHDVADDLPAAKEAQRHSWLGSSRPGGLDDSIGRMRD